VRVITSTPLQAPHLSAAPPHRYYEILTDPRPPRHSGHRAATLRTICSELLKVCNHPHLLPDFAPEEEAAGVAPVVAGASPMAMLLSASGKLQLLDRVLGLLKVHGQVRSGPAWHRVLRQWLGCVCLYACVLVSYQRMQWVAGFLGWC
jgi:hypothetical protein